MNLEAIDLYRQTQYLAKKITGAKISKIFMPTPTSLLLQLYKNEVLNLFCNLGGNGPALYLINNPPANPANPPAFCMLLRKHFEDSKIAEICQINFDRIIKIRADVLEGNKIVTKDLIFELTGRTNNILFVQDGKIIDCLKHINGAINRVRTILPNTEYIFPPKKLGLHPLAIEAEKLTAAIYANPADNLTDKIMHTLIGIGKHTAEILAKNNVAVAHNPQSNLKLASGVAPVADMLNDNVLVTVGTDGCSSNNNLDMLEEGRLACYLAKGTAQIPTVIPAKQALEIGTYNGAKALQFKNLGKLEKDFLADIVLYKMNESYWYPRHNLVSNLIYAASSNDVDTVIVDGKIIMKKREVRKSIALKNLLR